MVMVDLEHQKDNPLPTLFHLAINWTELNILVFVQSAQAAKLTTSRRSMPQKAWTSGMNPITQRSNTPAQQNGVGNRIKTGPSKTTGNQETTTPEKYANDRLLLLLANMMVSGS